MNPLDTYLREMRDIHSTGAAVEETSYYGPLATLLNEIGKTLKPKVHCVINTKNVGAGIPDGGLFTANEIQKDVENPMAGQLPARGVMEVKGPAQDVRKIAKTKQVQTYCAKYGLVLVTTYREFLIVGKDDQGRQIPMESYCLAESESAFWQALKHPQKLAHQHTQTLTEYLMRAMLHAAPLSDPKDVAWFLASYARDALARVEHQKDMAALAAVRKALEDALGMKFTGEKGEHFFRSTLVQTLFYGVFSAWVLWHKENPKRHDDFSWRQAEWSLRVPFIRALYEEVAKPSRLGSLGLVAILDWSAGALNRVNRQEFFQRFEERHAVQYFYEPFLEAFDPELRKQFGVWYTPEEIVQYQVARIDAVLREELDIENGLADQRVVVLDPCCGTGTYLVEVLKRIGQTLREAGEESLIASDLKKAAMERIFGFEIMPAPFVVAHLQLGLMLQSLGAPLDADSDQRVGVYLTNALTGWEPPKGPKQHVMQFPELQQERDAAEHVKRDARILVILGNPPYNAFAGVSPDEEQGLVDPYKEGLNTPVKDGGWGIKKFNLDDLYVRFFRIAERRIAEMSGKGVVSFISNFSYLSDPSFVVMRQRFLSEFDKLWLDCMNGDSRETGKLTPEGKPDPSVFSTESNHAGIRVGTSVCVVVRKEKRKKEPKVRFRHFWGVTKRQDLLDSLNAKDIDAAYTTAKPCKENRHSLRPENVSAEYNSWPKLSDLCVVRSDGLFEKRGGALFDIELDNLEIRMRDYFDENLSWQEYKEKQTALTHNMARFDPIVARKKALSEKFDSCRIVRYAVRPFDMRWCYYTGIRPIWNEPRPRLWENHFTGNLFLISRLKTGKTPKGSPIYISSALPDGQIISVNPSAIPIRLAKVPQNPKEKMLIYEEPKANLSTNTCEYLTGLGIRNPDADAETAGVVWLHALAVGYSPAYLSENADGIRRDWPRIPLPKTKDMLESSAALGKQVAALLDTETEVQGVTSGQLGAIFKTLGVITPTEGKTLDPDAGDLAVTAGWGHAGKGGVTMPGKGRIVQRDYEPQELSALRKTAEAEGLDPDKLLEQLGPDTRDVYLSDTAYWKNIPANVWGYYIGGYQVIKKWLSYRERTLLGRALNSDEAREVMNMSRRLAALVLLQPRLDDNYQAVAAETYPWPT